MNKLDLLQIEHLELSKTITQVSAFECTIKLVEFQITTNEKAKLGLEGKVKVGLVD